MSEGQRAPPPKKAYSIGEEDVALMVLCRMVDLWDPKTEKSEYNLKCISSLAIGIYGTKGTWKATTSLFIYICHSALLNYGFSDLRFADGVNQALCCLTPHEAQHAIFLNQVEFPSTNTPVESPTGTLLRGLISWAIMQNEERAKQLFIKAREASRPNSLSHTLSSLHLAFLYLAKNDSLTKGTREEIVKLLNEVKDAAPDAYFYLAQQRYFLAETKDDLKVVLDYLQNGAKLNSKACQIAVRSIEDTNVIDHPEQLSFLKRTVMSRLDRKNEFRSPPKPDFDIAGTFTFPNSEHFRVLGMDLFQFKAWYFEHFKGITKIPGAAGQPAGTASAPQGVSHAVTYGAQRGQPAGRPGAPGQPAGTASAPQVYRVQPAETKSATVQSLANKRVRKENEEDEENKMQPSKTKRRKEKNSH